MFDVYAESETPYKIIVVRAGDSPPLIFGKVRLIGQDFEAAYDIADLVTQLGFFVMTSPTPIVLDRRYPLGEWPR